MEKIFAASRYGRGEADYLNCPFNKLEYETFYNELLNAERAPLHDFDGELTVYEGCMPIEVMAGRGADTMRYGPLRPVGLRDPRTEEIDTIRDKRERYMALSDAAQAAMRAWAAEAEH